MNPVSNDSIVTYLGLLYNNRQLLADTYHKGTISLTEENRATIRKLQQQRVLLPYLQDQFRLAPSLNRHLDEVLQRQRNYAVSSNFADQTQRLVHLVDEYLKASYENRLDDRDTYEADFDAAVFELGENIVSSLLLLRTLTDNCFANVSTLAEKQRQNEYYIRQAEKLNEVLGALQAEEIVELFNTSLLSSLYSVYQYQLLHKLPEWRANLLDITTTLKNYLYRLRQIEPEAKRLRTFAHFLNRNPDYQTPDSENLPQPPSWAQRFSGLLLKTYPDLRRNFVRETLGEMARSIPATPIIRPQRSRETGKLILSDEEIPIVVLQPKRIQRLFLQYLQQASLSALPLSALKWKRQYTTKDLPTDEAWLLYVMHAIQTLRHNNNPPPFELRRIEAASSYLHSGNILVQDLELWKKA